MYCGEFLHYVCRFNGFDPSDLFFILVSPVAMPFV